MKKQLFLVGCTGILLVVGSLSARTLAQQPTSLPPAQQAPQGEISQEELQRFAKAVKQLQVIEQEAQQKMVEAVNSEGLTPERFLQIEQGRQQPEVQPTPEVSKEEKQKFEKALTQVKQIHQETQTKMQQALQAEGLEIERFNQLVAVVQQNPALQQQIQQMIKS